MTVLRGRSPKKPASGKEKQFGSKYCAAPPFTGFDEQPETRLGRCPAPPDRGSARARSTESTGVNGMPDRSVTMPATCHPAASPPASPVADRPKGTSHV